MNPRASLEPVREWRRRAGRAARRLRDRERLALPDENDLLRAFGGRHGRLDEALSDLVGGGAALVTGAGRGEMRAAYAACPAWRTRLLGAAARILEHRFDLLGSGERALGPRLPWHTDFKSGHAWDPDIPSEELFARVAREFGRGRDVKVPWELSRFQHAPLLAQAAWLDPDRRFYEELRSQVEDWVERNPVARGVNWGCTMDVALRGASLAVAAALFRDELFGDAVFASLLLRTLLAHGRFVVTHLEAGEPRGNHYLSDLAGLLVLADALRCLPEADEWRETATAGLQAHIAVQTLADGADFEASIPYHRLTTEMLLAAVVLLERRGGDTRELRPHLRRRIDYAAHYTKPDGLAPQIGDNDDGRFLVLGEHGADRRDHRALLAAAAVLFDEPALLALAGDRREEALWIHGPAAVERLASRTSTVEARVTSAVFRDAGAAILRGAGFYVHFEAGGVGLGGHGGHAHNDTLSVEIQAGGEDLIVDPGTGGYTADLAERDRFRATAAHNTVRVDGEEINPIPPNPFRLPGIDRPSIARTVFRRHFDLVEAAHRGYARLPDPVTHRRILLLSRTTRRLLIEDALLGKGVHRLEWFFHLAPRVEGTIADDGRAFLGRAGTVRFRLAAAQAPTGARFTLAPDRVSPGYGRTVEARTLRLAWEGTLPVAARFHLTLESA